MTTPLSQEPLDDHLFAALAATDAGRVLEKVRLSGLEGKALKDAGDLAAHEFLMQFIGEHRPGDAILSEEGKDDKGRLTSSRVWIIDPVDGTREFSEPPRTDWAIHVALWQDGELVAGAVATRLGPDLFHRRTISGPTTYVIPAAYRCQSYAAT